MYRTIGLPPSSCVIGSSGYRPGDPPATERDERDERAEEDRQDDSAGEQRETSAPIATGTITLQ